MSKLNLDHLGNAKKAYSMDCIELKSMIFWNSDDGRSNRIALAKKTVGGSVNILTDFMTYNEMNHFLRGYWFKAAQKFPIEVVTI